LELETDNLVAAVRRALASDPQTLASITTSLRRPRARARAHHARPHDAFLDLLDRALEPADVVGVAYALRARAYEARGRARRARHDLQHSLADLEAALSSAGARRTSARRGRSRTSARTT